MQTQEALRLLPLWDSAMCPARLLLVHNFSFVAAACTVQLWGVD